MLFGAPVVVFYTVSPHVSLCSLVICRAKTRDRAVCAHFALTKQNCHMLIWSLGDGGWWVGQCWQIPDKCYLTREISTEDQILFMKLQVSYSSLNILLIICIAIHVYWELMYTHFQGKNHAVAKIKICHRAVKVTFQQFDPNFIL